MVEIATKMHALQGCDIRTCNQLLEEHATCQVQQHPVACAGSALTKAATPQHPQGSLRSPTRAPHASMYRGCTQLARCVAAACEPHQSYSLDRRHVWQTHCYALAPAPDAELAGQECAAAVPQLRHLLQECGPMYSNQTCLTPPRWSAQALDIAALNIAAHKTFISDRVEPSHQACQKAVQARGCTHYTMNHPF